MVARFRSWWQQIKTHPMVSVLIAFVIALVVLVILGGYLFHWDWAGFNGNIKSGKTLWDWLQLLFIPVVLVIAGFWFNHRERKAAELRAENERKAAELRTEAEREIEQQRAKTERDIALDNQREVALQSYIDKLSELLLEKQLRESKPEDEVRKIGRVRTLTVLPRLDDERKKSVLQFLNESGLIVRHKIIIDLNGVFLRGANLSRVDLRLTNLRGAILSDADLRGADLSSANLKGADLRGANLNEANLGNADLSRADLRETNLSEAYLLSDMPEPDLPDVNFSGANLKGADLKGAGLSGDDLSYANLKGADLSGAGLGGANLSGANLLEANLSSAHLSTANLNSADLSGANLSFANLSEADLGGDISEDDWLEGMSAANLSRTNLSGANLSRAKVATEQLDQAKSLTGATMPDGSIHP
jgi:uncharacterized protein YjbI with pentapeptide repeats/uncharacterized membrane protein